MHSNLLKAHLILRWAFFFLPEVTQKGRTRLNRFWSNLH